MVPCTATELITFAALTAATTAEFFCECGQPGHHARQLRAVVRRLGLADASAAGRAVTTRLAAADDANATAADVAAATQPTLTTSRLSYR